VKSQSREVFEALTQGGITASSHPPVSISHQSSKSRVSGSSETKTYGKGATRREHEELPTLPRRPFFGKDGDERSRVFNALHVLVSPAYALFSGKMSYTAIARRGRASS
jgi:hypothetical protein